MVEEVEGIVIREVKYRDADRILTLYTKEYGRITASANGARRMKSPLHGVTLPFVRGEYSIYFGRKMNRIQSGQILSSHYGISENLDQLAYGQYLFELVALTTPEGESNERDYALLAKTLEVLTKVSGGALRSLIHAFELKHLAFLGLRPQLSACAVCGKQESNFRYFHAQHGGAICSDCVRKTRGSMRVSESVIPAMRFLLMTSFEEIIVHPIPEPELKQIETCILEFIFLQTDRRDFRSLAFLRQIQASSSD
ncbi:DNA repair protein RecO [Gottschalkiaceae bacterium SANA]|nr:DNA repair protein RecO [Gottschalkiaceae bacterium SANA]